MLITGMMNVTMNIMANISNNDSILKGCIKEDANTIMNRNK
jgi:hypothetical protein